MPRKGENIYKRKDGRWEGRYIKEHIGKRAKYGYIYGKTYSDVKKKLLLKKLDVTREKQSSKDTLFKYISIAWLDSCRINCKESTIIKYKNLLEHYIYPYLGQSKISGIMSCDIKKMCEDLYLHGGKGRKGLSPKTISDTLSVLRQIRTYAIQEQYSVFFEIENIKVRNVQKYLRVFDIQEQMKLYQYFLENQSFSNFGMLLCLYTGMRIGELCALKWEDISFERRTVYIHRTMLRIQTENKEKRTKIIVTTPKSSCSVRTIPLPDFLLGIALSYQQVPDAYVLTGSTEKYTEPRTMQNRYKMVLKECNIADANFHALRHYVEKNKMVSL